MTTPKNESTPSVVSLVDSLLKAPTSRRRFLKWGSVAAAGVATSSALAACGPEQQRPVLPGGAALVPSGHSDQADHNQTTGTSTPLASGGMSAEEMDRLHEEGVKSYPAATQGQGMQPLEPKMDGNVKVFDLTVDKVMWEVEPGKQLEAWVYNEQLPGPEIRVTEGDAVRINVTNNLDQSTSIHWHGLLVPNNMDGVTYMNQPPIKPGETFVYEFVTRNSGSHMYHSHHNSTKQVSMGLLGPFIIEPKDKSQDPEYDIDTTMILNDTAHGFTINGKGFPATQPIVAKLGQKVRLRYMNEGMMIHPMHLHGMPQLVFAKDGWNLPQPFMCDTLNIAPGERWDVIIDCTEPGVWAFHCHILSHAESERGMFGMVTALIVQE